MAISERQLHFCPLPSWTRDFFNELDGLILNSAVLVIVVLQSQPNFPH
jgi:hypothetical protein